MYFLARACYNGYITQKGYTMITITDQSEVTDIEVETNCSHTRGTHQEEASDDYVVNGLMVNDSVTVNVCDHCDEQIMENL